MKNAPHTHRPFTPSFPSSPISHTLPIPRTRALVALLALVLIFSARGAWAARIEVNSTTWGDDSDTTTCTLWEAVKTTREEEPPGIGGCIWSSGRTINLEAGETYVTQAQLPKVNASVTIWGNGAVLETDATAPDHRFFNIGGPAMLKLIDITLSGGKAARGGAIWVGQGAAFVATRLRLLGNQATLGGGAIYSRGTVNLDFTTLRGNSASNGGGLAAEKGHVDIATSTFVDNVASSKGGAIVAWPGLNQLTVSNSTFSANEGAQGGAIYRAGLPTPSSDTVTQTTFKANRVTHLGEGNTFYLAAPVDVVLAKSALWEDDPDSRLCAGDLADLASAGHNATTDTSCGLDHLEDHPGVSFTLSDLVDHGAWAKVHVPRCDEDPVGYDCSILMDQYECIGAELDQRGVQRDFGGAHLGDMDGLCDIGSYESICHSSYLSPSSNGTANFTTLLYTDQLKRDGNVLNSGACAGVGEAWQFPENTSNCDVSWLMYWGSNQPLDLVAVWFLEPDVPCAYDCFEDPEACKNHCTRDPNHWKAPLPELGFEVPSWNTPPNNTLMTLVSPACEVPKVRYVMEFANGVVRHWDPEVAIESGDSAGSGGNQGSGSNS